MNPKDKKYVIVEIPPDEDDTERVYINVIVPGMDDAPPLEYLFDTIESDT